MATALTIVNASQNIIFFCCSNDYESGIIQLLLACLFQTVSNYKVYKVMDKLLMYAYLV